MQNAKCRMQNCSASNSAFLHSAFCILHSSSGAKGGTRTPTASRPMDPRSIASANSATLAHKKRTLAVLEKVGAPTRTRTWNQQIKSLLLYQLSYGGKARCNEPPRANISRGGRGFYRRARGRSIRGERLFEHPVGPAQVG